MAVEGYDESAHEDSVTSLKSLQEHPGALLEACGLIIASCSLSSDDGCPALSYPAFLLLVARVVSMNSLIPATWLREIPVFVWRSVH